MTSARHQFPTDTTADILAEAHRIIAGDGIEYETQAYWDWTDLRDAAEMAVDGDYSDLIYMKRQQRLFDLWCRVSESEQAYWRDDFADWARFVGERWLANIERQAA